MTAPDRTDELVRAMLERRSRGTTPEWLVTETMQQVVRSRQARRPGGGPFDGAGGTRMLLVATVALALLALASVLVAGALRRREPEPLNPPALVVEESAPASVEPTSSTDRGDVEPTATATAVPAQDVPAATSKPAKTTTPARTPPPAAIPPLEPDSIAQVTPEGDRLRVRMSPGTGPDSVRLEPVLSAGTEMLVIDGPRQLDGYDWYRVHVPDEMLSGWVASGFDGAAWVTPAELECPIDPDGSDVYQMSELERFACWRGDDLEVHAVALSPGDAESGCSYVPVASPCSPEPAWLIPNVVLDVGARETAGETGESMAFGVALAPSAGDVTDEMSLGSATVRLAFDVPEAAGCRVLDETGDDALERWDAVAQCRLRTVVTAIEPDQ